MQLVMSVPLSVNVTVPDVAVGATVAVYVTAVPVATGEMGLSVVVVAATTVSTSAVDADVRKALVPEYVAMML